MPKKPHKQKTSHYMDTGEKVWKTRVPKTTPPPIDVDYQIVTLDFGSIEKKALGIDSETTDILKAPPSNVTLADLKKAAVTMTGFLIPQSLNGLWFPNWLTGRTNRLSGFKPETMENRAQAMRRQEGKQSRVTLMVKFAKAEVATVEEGYKRREAESAKYHSILQKALITKSDRIQELEADIESYKILLAEAQDYRQRHQLIIANTIPSEGSRLFREVV